MLKKRQISDQEKNEILLEHGRNCFIDGAPIPKKETVEFHHIKPFSQDGPTNKDNIAPVCKQHHRRIGTMSLQEYRDKIRLGVFFQGNPKYLNDVIKEKTGKGIKKFTYEILENKIIFYFENFKHEYPIHICPITTWKYLYATIPIEYLKNDKDLQPRAIREGAMWQLYCHFLSNTQFLIIIDIITINILIGFIRFLCFKTKWKSLRVKMSFPNTMGSISIIFQYLNTQQRKWTKNCGNIF